MTKAKFQGSPLSRYGTAGPPVQHSDVFTIQELIELILREEIKPEQLFSREEIINDPKLKAYVDSEILKKQEEEKLKEDELIPGSEDAPLTKEQLEQQKKDNELIPGGKYEPDDDDLIPD